MNYIAQNKELEHAETYLKNLSKNRQRQILD